MLFIYIAYIKKDENRNKEILRLREIYKERLRELSSIANINHNFLSVFFWLIIFSC